MNENIIEFLIAVITLVGATITYLVVPYIKSKTTTEQQKNIEYWIKFGVKAADQIFSGEEGKKKKEYVLKFINELGFKITDKQVDVLIEAAVREINI